MSSSYSLSLKTDSSLSNSRSWRREAEGKQGHTVALLSPEHTLCLRGCAVAPVSAAADQPRRAALAVTPQRGHSSCCVRTQSQEAGPTLPRKQTGHPEFARPTGHGAPGGRGATAVSGHTHPQDTLVSHVALTAGRRQGIVQGVPSKPLISCPLSAASAATPG